MTACVFLGPTLPLARAREVLAAEYLPPVRQGDVYRAVRRRRPRAIGIVDGYFHQVPSVWHKEILWALAEGVHVFGSASMGALRAAELEPFGMRGVGDVFRAFRDRVLEDDDEVAVIHGPAEIGFPAASEAMINIRRTLHAAETEAIVGAPTRRRLEDIAKSLFYPSRGYPRLLKRAAAEGLPESELAALTAWLERGRVDMKREDALEMLNQMRDLLAADPAPMRVDYAFEHTTMWEAAITEIDAGEDAHLDASERSIENWLLDEVRLDARVYDDLRRAALLRLLARREAERRNVTVDDDEVRRTATNFRLSHALHFGRDLTQWLAERDLDRPTFERLLEDDVLVGKLCNDAREQVVRRAIDLLRMNGDYTRLIARARVKRQAALAAEDNGGDEEDPLTAMQAMAWYFGERLGAQLPDDLDAYAVRLGFKGAGEFRRAVLREYRIQPIGVEMRGK